MLTLDQECLARLREMAQRGVAPATMLRKLLERMDQLHPEEPRAPILALYLMEALGLEVHQVSSVFAWDPNGAGQLSDADLDKYLGRHLQTKTGMEGLGGLDSRP
jgi:hypothetical protein